MSALTEVLIDDSLVAEQNAIVRDAEALQIDGEPEYQIAAEFLLSVKDLAKRIVGTFADPKSKSYAAWKAICAAEKKELEPVERAESTIKRKMAKWEAIERQRREEERKKLAEAARKIEEDRRLALAIEAENAGRNSEAEKILARPTPVPVIHVPEPAKVSGISYRTTYTAEVVDLAAFIEWVSKDIETRGHFLTPNQQAINSRAREMKDAFRLPGCELRENRGVAAGRR